MSLKWGEEEIKGFSSPAKKAERTNDWAWWPVIITVVIAMSIALSKIL